MKVVKKNGFSIYIPIIGAILIALFLSGIIVPIPFGTHKGGVIGAIGVGIILLIMFVIIILTKWIYKKKNNKHLL